MTQRPRIVLIHATRVAMEPIETAFRGQWPEAETLSLLEEGLSLDLASGRATRAQLDRRIVALADYARDMSPDAILYTCSSFGAGIEAAAERYDLPVLKPNEAMFEAAIGCGGQVTMLYTFAPAAAGMEREFRQEAARRGAGAGIRSVLVEGALDALKAGDPATHDRLVAEAAAGLDPDGTSAIMLAHFSTSRAADAVRAATRLPVLTSPETAVAKLRTLLGTEAGAEEGGSW